jgi:hypothetical protein
MIEAFAEKTRALRFVKPATPAVREAQRLAERHHQTYRPLYDLRERLQGPPATSTLSVVTRGFSIVHPRPLGTLDIFLLSAHFSRFIIDASPPIPLL